MVAGSDVRLNCEVKQEPSLVRLGQGDKPRIFAELLFYYVSTICLQQSQLVLSALVFSHRRKIGIASVLISNWPQHCHFFVDRLLLVIAANEECHVRLTSHDLH